MGVSLILSSYKRAKLLNLGLASIVRQRIKDPEVIVVNDGIEDDTESTVNHYRRYLDMKYLFSGQRNLNGDKPRVSGFALNIGVKRSKYDLIILSCPEIYHIGDTLKEIISPLTDNPKRLTIPQSMYFDETGEFTDFLSDGFPANVRTCEHRNDHVVMPFLMGMWKKEFFDIGGYDEDFTGYASEDNDFVDRLVLNGCVHHRVDAKIVHLYHGKHKMEGTSWDNPQWAYNRNLYIGRKNIIVRNQNKEWGVI